MLAGELLPGMVGMSPRRARALVAAIAVAVPVPALSAAQSLGPPRTFASGNPFVPSALSWTTVALNVRGDAVVGGLIARTGGSIPVVRQRARSRGSWGAPVRLAAGRAQTSAPVVAVNEGGAAIAVFGSGGRLWTVRRGATGGWTRASTVASLTPRHVERVALLGDGRARLVVAQANRACSFAAPCTWTITVLQQPARGGAWTTVGSPIAVPAMNGVPRLVTSRTGHVLMTWSQSGETWGARILADESAIEPPVELAPVEGAWPAIGDGGDAAVAYGVEGSSPATGRGLVRLRPVAQGWGSPEEVVPPTAATPSMRAAVDRDGNVAAAWTRFTAGGRTNGEAVFRRARAAAWSSAGVLTTSSDIETLQIAQIAVDAGRVKIIWDRHLGPGDNVTQLTSYGAQNHWSTVSRVTADGYPPSGFGTAADGDALLVDHDMTVRNFDAVPTPAAARTASPRVRVRGRYATVSFSLNLRATVYAQRTGPLGSGSRTRLTDPRVMAPGTRRITLGPLPRGRHQVSLAACHAARGCTFSRPAVVAFRIR